MEYGHTKNTILWSLRVIAVTLTFLLSLSGCGISDKVDDTVGQPLLKSAHDGTAKVSIFGEEVLPEDISYDGDRYVWESGSGAAKQEAARAKAAYEEENARVVVGDPQNDPQNDPPAAKPLVFSVFDHSSPGSNYDVTINEVSLTASIVETNYSDDGISSVEEYSTILSPDELNLLKLRLNTFKQEKPGIRKDAYECQLAFIVYLFVLEKHKEAVQFLGEWWDGETKEVMEYLEHH